MKISSAFLLFELRHHSLCIKMRIIEKKQFYLKNSNFIQFQTVRFSKHVPQNPGDALVINKVQKQKHIKTGIDARIRIKI